MTERHRKAIQELNKIHKDNPKNIALIIYGSIAREDSKENSDIDLCLVVADQEFERISKTKSYFYGTWDPNEFFGIEIDGKIVGMQYLRDAAKHGSDQIRYSFKNAYPLFTKSDEVNKLIKDIYIYPEWEHEKKIKAFYGFVKHYRYLGESAFQQGNIFHAKHCTLELIFFAGRLILAHNHQLFPSHKALFKAVERCKEKPENFIDLSQNLLLNNNLEEMLNYYEKVISYFEKYDYSDIERIGIILENEWTWYTKQLTISEW